MAWVQILPEVADVVALLCVVSQTDCHNCMYMYICVTYIRACVWLEEIARVWLGEIARVWLGEIAWCVAGGDSTCVAGGDSTCGWGR